MTNVTFLTVTADGRITSSAADRRMSSHQPTLRKGVPWGFLAWTLPLAYVFWAPFQQHAGWIEWTATAATLSAVLALFLVGLTYGEYLTVVASVCAGLVLISIGFLAYRPSGGIYFPMVATFVPALVRGRISLVIVILAILTALFGFEWGLLYLEGPQGVIFPAFVVGEILLTGIGVTVIFRQTREIQRRDKAAERERIAKDLHDVLGHALSSLTLKAELARRLFHTDPQRALEEIGDVERIARQGLEDMRGAVHGYYSGDIYEEFDRVESLLSAAGVNVERRCERLEMPAANERVFALIVREAVTNILRHSRATRCRVALFRDNGVYRLEISDNGRGGAHEEGVGMRSIRTRAEALGGSAMWNSAVGTQLSVSLPISVSERA